MSARGDGGPAFPMNSEEDRNGNVMVYAQYGMSLRDYFAAKAMGLRFSGDARACDEKELAALVYKIADAMIAERAK